MEPVKKDNLDKIKMINWDFIMETSQSNNNDWAL